MVNKPNVDEDGQEVRNNKAENARARDGLRAFAHGGIGRRGGAAGHRAGGAAPNMTANQREEIYKMPSIAITTQGKVLQRWEVGGQSHWVVGGTQTYDGVPYKLKRIQKTAGVCYLICEATQ